LVADNYNHTGLLGGVGTIFLDNSYDLVDIENYSPRNLVLGDINFWDTDEPSVVLDAADAEVALYPIVIVVLKPPVLQVLNQGGADVVVNGKINNFSGQAQFTSSGGSVLDPSGSNVYARSFTLLAPNGSLGTAGQPLELWMQDGVLSAQAGGD